MSEVRERLGWPMAVLAAGIALSGGILIASAFVLAEVDGMVTDIRSAAARNEARLEALPHSIRNEMERMKDDLRHLVREQARELTRLPFLPSNPPPEPRP